jgi:AcrR family transcriptional regulator
VGRPKEPLIVRDHVFEAALELIDRRGIERFSMRALADALGVSAASLYHHFHDKGEILDGAAHLALVTSRDRGAGEPRSPEDQIVTIVVDAYVALQEHPGILPVLVRRADREFAIVVHGSVARLLRQSGVPEGLVVSWLDILEGLLIGTAVLEAHTEIDYRVEATTYPVLHASLTNTDQTLDAAQRLEIAVRALLAGSGDRDPAARPT